MAADVLAVQRWWLTMTCWSTEEHLVAEVGLVTC